MRVVLPEYSKHFLKNHDEHTLNKEKSFEHSLVTQEHIIVKNSSFTHSTFYGESMWKVSVLQLVYM